MKDILKPTNLPEWILGTGGIGLLLRIWLLKAGTDDNGFLISTHPANILLWILTAIVLGALLLLTKDLIEATKYPFNFPASTLSGYGAYVAAAGIGICTIIDLSVSTAPIEVVSCLLGLLAALMLAYSGYCRGNGLQPPVLVHIAISLYLMVRLICLYRRWSSDPQLLDYCFPLLATVCLMLATYHRASFNADFGKRRPYAFFSLSAIYFSCLSMTGWANIPFFLSTIVWMATDLCSLIPMPGRSLFQFRQGDD